MAAKKPSPLWIFALVAVGLALAGFSQIQGQFLTWQLGRAPLHVPVPPLAQAETTSCGEAAITMVYNYAYPTTPVSEAMVIEYAAAQGYFTEGVPPFTSPANMVKIARNFATEVETGNVATASQGLTLLVQKLQSGEPVIIDVLTWLNEPGSEAHFVVVTGVSVDPARENAVVIHYNNPLNGRNESADWAGPSGIWNAWQNNGDPGGRGWWLVIALP